MALPDLMHMITETWYDIYMTCINQSDVPECTISHYKWLVW